MIKATKCVAAGFAVVAAFILAACTPADADGDLGTTQPPTTSRSTATTGPLETSPPGTGERPAPVDVEWRSVLTLEVPSSDFEVLQYTHEAIVSQRIVAEDVTLTHTAADGTTRVLEREREKYVQRAWLWGEQVLLLSTAAGGWEPPYQLELWTPGELTTRPLTAARGVDTLIEAELAGDDLYYIVEDLQGSCLYRAGFPDGDSDLVGKRITCSSGEETGLWWLVTSGSDVSWIASSKNRVAPTNGEFTCSTLVRLASGADTPEVVPGADCVSRGAASAQLAVWSDAPAIDPGMNASSWDVAMMHVAATGVSVADAGIGSAGSEVSCAGLVLWKSVANTATGENLGDQHRAWTPERGAMLLSSPAGSVADDAFGRLQCIDETTIGMQRFNVVTRVVDYFVADLSHLTD